MRNRFTQGDWVATDTTIEAGPAGTLATLNTMYRTADEVKANALLMAAAPRLARALAVMVLDPRIRRYLEQNDPKALEQAGEALTAARVFEQLPAPRLVDGG